MPNSVTHAYFSIDVLNKLDDTKRKLLNNHQKQLRTFSEGPDVFYFNNLLYPFRGKDISELGHYMHLNDTQNFFVTLITIIKDRKLFNEPEIMAFLYGFICHYILDMTIHPYVIYKTGNFEKNDQSTYKYIGGHAKLEIYLDAYLIKVRDKIKPSKFKPHIYCFNYTSISNQLKELIDEVFIKVFKKKNMGKYYEDSIKQTRAFYKWFRYDKYGIKKVVYKIAKFIPVNVRFEVLSYFIKLNKNDYYLNLDKESWYHPLDKTKVYSYSVIELYAIALNRTLRLIKEIDSVLKGQYSIEYLNKLFPNLSYMTGHDCKLGIGTYFSY